MTLIWGVGTVIAVVIDLVKVNLTIEGPLIINELQEIKSVLLFARSL